MSTLPRSMEVDTQGLSNYPTVSDVVGAASFTCFTCSTLAETLTKLSVVPMSYCCVWEVGADKARKEGASSISEIGPRGL
ncbi:hypothetical protein ACFX2F_040091 [Malus domestica]